MIVAVTLAWRRVTLKPDTTVTVSWWVKNTGSDSTGYETSTRCSGVVRCTHTDVPTNLAAGASRSSSWLSFASVRPSAATC